MKVYLQSFVPHPNDSKKFNILAENPSPRHPRLKRNNSLVISSMVFPILFQSNDNKGSYAVKAIQKKVENINEIITNGKIYVVQVTFCWPSIRATMLNIL